MAPGPWDRSHRETVRIPLSRSCSAQAHGDTRGQHEEGPAPRALGWRTEVTFGSKRYKTRRAPAGTTDKLFGKGS